MKSKRLVAVLLASLIVLCACASAMAMRKYLQTEGGYNHYIRCALSNKNKDGYITLFSANGYSGRRDVKLTDDKGNNIWEGTFNLGDSLRLGNDHKVYRVYVKGADDHLNYRTENIAVQVH